jgi:hypothetical protein
VVGKAVVGKAGTGKAVVGEVGAERAGRHLVTSSCEGLTHYV